MEECGIKEIALVKSGLFDIDIHQIPGTKKEPTHLHYDLRFLFCTKNSTPTAGSDAVNCEWVHFSTAKQRNPESAMERVLTKLR